MRQSTFAPVLRNGEFRALWTAEFGSLVGDQLARVAVAVLVFQRTSSATAATATYALSIVPSVLGGVLLSWTADRYPRRTVMVVADLVRALLVAVMAVPGLPVPLIATLLVLVVVLRAPHTAAQGAVLPQVLGESYEQGLVLRQISSQIAQVGGFAVGGLAVALLQPAGALLIDVATFVVSAVLVRFGTAARARPDGHRRPAAVRAVTYVLAGARAIAADPARRTLVLMATICGSYVVPEAIAVPYAAQVGAGPTEVGLLMAAGPLGGVVGAWAFVRFVPLAARERQVGVVAVLAAVPMLPVLAAPPVPLALGCWAVSGAFATAYLLQGQASFVRRTPDAERGQALGVASSAMIASQGIAIVLAGILADAATPAVAVAVAGALGFVAAAVVAVVWHRTRDDVVPAASGPS
ncbi:MFS transporter [Pseudonocardia sp. CA-107938]|uniref:MFS transporter n=1 Tax=Pseudonocardia sp. CA-107938 TaxID=3240021 RepID=UPI003D94BCA7